MNEKAEGCFNPGNCGYMMVFTVIRFAGCAAGTLPHICVICRPCKET